MNKILNNFELITERGYLSMRQPLFTLQDGYITSQMLFVWVLHSLSFPKQRIPLL
jgi:hypothetical protein